MTRLERAFTATDMAEPDLGGEAPGCAVATVVRPLPAGCRPKTVLVLGAPRGGTTMTAGLMIRLGVPFGDKVNEKGEDVDVDETLPALGSLVLPPARAAAKRRLARLAEARVSAWGQWGLKHPNLTLRMSALGAAFPDPAFIMVTRATRAVARSNQRRVSLPYPIALVRAHAHAAALHAQARRAAAPTLVLSYEATVADRRAAVDAVADFLRLDVSDAERATAAQFAERTGAYLSARRLNGYVETLDADHAVGWVCDQVAGTTPLTVEAWRDGERMAAAPATNPRPDVQAASNHPDGACGFTLRFPNPLAPSDRDRLVFFVPEIAHRLAFRLNPGLPPLRHGPNDLSCPRDPRGPHQSS